MPIRSNIFGDECIVEYATTAESLMEDGYRLLTSGSTNGVKLLGESVEMFLKSMYFSYVKLSDADAISKADLTNALQDAGNLNVTESHESYHGLRFWAELVIAKRVALRGLNAFVSSDEQKLRNAVTRLSTNWKITDRYRNIQAVAGSQDVEEVFEDAMSVWNLYPQLRK